MSFVDPLMGYDVNFHKNESYHLLPPGSEQYEVLLFGSIQEGILQALH